jgi:HlyD family type I secretion membrane fusion protein
MTKQTSKDRSKALPTSDVSAERESFGIRSRVVIGVALAFFLVFGIGGWAAVASLSGAVISSGSVVVDENLKAVQHRDGGIIGHIAVREGDHVVFGQVLFRLDDAQTRAELSIVRSQLTEQTAKKARLIAERDGFDAIQFPDGFYESHPEAGVAVAGETRLFSGNLTHRQSQKQQLELQIAQISEEIAGLEGQRDSKADEYVLVEAEYAKLKSLADRGLVEGSRMFAVSRERWRLPGERANIDASIARAKTRISEIRVQILSIQENARTEAQRELSLVETKLSELINRRAALEDRLSRTDIRAPISGRVNELKVHTIGGVITPAEVLATIVPAEARLKVEVKIAPISIDQVSVGRPARLRFSTFNQRTTPELVGELAHVSPATTRDPGTGQMHYVGHVIVEPDELAKLGTDKLVPGMPVEVFITTDERTAFSYLVRPLTDQFSRAFRER